MSDITTITYNNITNFREDNGCIEFDALIDENFSSTPVGRNPRTVDTKSPRYKNIISSLKKNDPRFRFHWNNRGIQCTAASYKHDDRRGTVTVEYNKKDRQGHFDGGHTDSAICVTVRSDPKVCEHGHRVRFRIFTKYLTDKEIEQIAFNNNDAKPQEARNHANLDGHFDPMKASLSKEALANVSFYDGDPGTYRVEDLISLQIATTGNWAAKFFDKTSGRTKKITSVRQYYRKGASSKVKWYLNRTVDLSKIVDGGKKSLFADVVGLYDYILSSSEELYESNKKTGSYSKLGMHSSENKFGRVTKNRTFDGKIVNNALAPTFALMILEGLLKHELEYDKVTKTVKWRKASGMQSAKERYAEEAPAVIKRINDRWLSAKSNGTTVRDFSEDVSIWTDVYQLLG